MVILTFSYVSTGVVYVNGLCLMVEAPQLDEAVTGDSSCSSAAYSGPRDGGGDDEACSKAVELIFSTSVDRNRRVNENAVLCKATTGTSAPNLSAFFILLLR
ncbi:hypothetical protein PC118_g6215 [Phytophthora cactorum]|uniref:Uncharacterized protein n=1 Tax=Phytophthora cactorum TaxID=29920 RepID=A0A8T1DZ35_9STRA|nr:hypothetical protein PC112_g7098 [Phytophthora cactorum]KAG2946980.1 hypothetical protein PC117_g7191 [Phytophthora cactorum]KAG2989376.1 hypothetical protein PC118_g6215 [Phytophthora cactorum]KAG3025843.1 hypothetical protein PC120_g6222 [Phytophthora cactorum]KAG3074970.1 hypothetical protein PC121_g8195 [Phytophthora cactorum]